MAEPVVQQPQTQALGTWQDVFLITDEDKRKDINCVWNQFQDLSNEVYWI